MCKKLYTLAIIFFCCSQAIYSQSSIQIDSLELIKYQIKGIEEKLRLGALEKNMFADSAYIQWKTQMETKLFKLVLLKEEYEK
tara:strand:- start:172 stop:420 length:249 start_codon:yes stop_codon:yes gene_type:complete